MISNYFNKSIMKHCKMEEFDFLTGDWKLEYRIPESVFCKAASYGGRGSLKKILNDKYILFEYKTEAGIEAKGIFARDEKIKMYRYWWYEDSGDFMAATCSFINEDTLWMNWHDSLLIQTFTRITADRVILEMKHPDSSGNYSTILTVILTR